MQNEKTQNKTGFTILYAVLISSLLIAVGASIFNISLKELVLSSIASDSVRAIYAADAGIECSLYWEQKNPGEDSAFATTSVNHTIHCSASGGANDNLDATPQELTNGLPPYPSYSRSAFSLTFPDGDATTPDPCARIEVTKDFPSDTSGMRTTIVARGYNTGDVSCQSDADPRRVERAMQIRF